MRVTLMLLLGHVLLSAAQICRVLSKASHVMITEHRVVHSRHISTLHVISDRDGAMLVLLTHSRRSLRLLRLRADALEVLLKRRATSGVHLWIILGSRARIILLLRVLLVKLRDVQVDGSIVLTRITHFVSRGGVAGRELCLLACRRRLVVVRLRRSALLQRHHLLLRMGAASSVLLLGRHEVLRHVLGCSHTEVYRVSGLLVHASSNVALARTIGRAQRVLLRLVEVHIGSRRPALSDELVQAVPSATSIWASSCNRARGDYATLRLVEVNCLSLIELDLAELGSVSGRGHGSLPLMVGTARGRPDAVRVVRGRIQLDLLVVVARPALILACSLIGANNDSLVVTFACGRRAGTLANRVRVLLHFTGDSIRHLSRN